MPLGPPRAACYLSSVRKAPWLLVLLSLAGCPRDVASPPVPDGTPCLGDEDCNEERCGAWRECLDGVCEDVPSRAIPCTG